MLAKCKELYGSIGSTDTFTGFSKTAKTPVLLTLKAIYLCHSIPDTIKLPQYFLVLELFYCLVLYWGRTQFKIQHVM